MAKVFLLFTQFSFFLDSNVHRGGVLAVQPFYGRVLSLRLCFREYAFSLCFNLYIVTTCFRGTVSFPPPNFTICQKQLPVLVAAPFMFLW